MIIASTLVSSSSFLLIKSNNSSIQAEINVNSAQWQQFTVWEGGFSVFLPHKPKETIDPVGIGAGTLHNFFLSCKIALTELVMQISLVFRVTWMPVTLGGEKLLEMELLAYPVLGLVPGYQV